MGDKASEEIATTQPPAAAPVTAGSPETAALAPGAPTTARVLALQRAIGNQATARLVQRRSDIEFELQGDRAEKARAAAEAAKAKRAADPAYKLIDANTRWSGLDHKALGATMIGLLPGQLALFHDVFDKLDKSNRDDVAEAFANAATDDVLKVIAKDGNGRDGLRRVVRELLAGWSTGNENKQMRRIMAIISEQAPLVERGSGLGKTIEIEVVTFDMGGKAMDWAGENLARPVWKYLVWHPWHEKANQFGKGARGHTAILVGGLAYSYEGTGWRVGLTAQEYMKEATKERDATSQVLLLPIEDAKKVQKHLNAAANTGLYLIGGEICSDATGTALEQALGTMTKDANPQHLKQAVEASGKVAARRYYKAGGDGLPAKQ